MLRRSLVAALLGLLLSAIGYQFWHDDWVYRLPTPVPAGYRAVTPGTLIRLEGSLPQVAGTPLFIHFFNPRCPCSRFNLPHVRSLVRQYGDRVRFTTVVLDPDSSYTVQDVQDRLGAPVPVSFDRSIAERCGVYSTPQAVLIDAEGRLAYRGNYNKSRYCTDKATNYAEQAIVALLRGGAGPLHGPEATTSYGCMLPICTR
jgi:hypothetical protein